ncbi:MAG: alpha-glucan family phosphorylase [Planctomycetota bacterium]
MPVDILDKLRTLGRNLYWTWHPEVIDIFQDLDPELWRELNHNPMEFLHRLSPQRLQERLDMLAIDARISQAFHHMEEYLRDKNVWGAWQVGPLRTAPVAYFSAEFGLHESLPTYAGGLGMLAGDHLKAASDIGVPLVGVGLFYARGYFSQRLDASGWQHEDYSTADVEHLPLTRALDAKGQPLRVHVETDRNGIWAGLWTAQVGRNRLILLDTNVEGNDEECRGLTSQLYGGDRRVRIRQELVLGVGGMRAMAAMGIRPGVLHLNEGHSAFAVLEMARTLMNRDGRNFESVQDFVAARTVFTTHTPVEAGHDRFDAALVEETLGPLRRELKIAPEQLMALGRRDPGNAAEPFCMTILGLKVSQHRNGVSDLHGHVSRAMWQGLWPGRPVDEVPIGHITNGVHTASWLSVPVAQMYRRHLGENWQQRMCDPEVWAGVDRIDDLEFWEQQQILKAHLVGYVRRRVRQQELARGATAPAGRELDPAVLTIGFARRFAEYKRGDLILRDPDRLARLVNDPTRPVQIICAGKSHPADDKGKALIQKVFQFAHDARFAGRIVFVEDYNINVARHMVHGVDVWLNTPLRPMEACGTSGQKVVLNGGLNLSTLDGWWAQAYDGTNGFAIGVGGEHVDPARQGELDAGALYDVLENEVVPLFYDRGPDGVPRGWVARQKNAIRTLAWNFSAHRMMMDYTLRCYLPASGGLTAPTVCPYRRGQ